VSKQSDSAGAIATGMAVTAAALAAGFAVVAVNLGLGFAIPVAIVALLAAAVISQGPLGKALARRLEGGSAPGDQDAAIHALEEMRGRMAELEERVDFAERLLAQTREPDRLRE
jgi:membrane protein implicated in regulation of membrane protease activity